MVRATLLCDCLFGSEGVDLHQGLYYELFLSTSFQLAVWISSNMSYGDPLYETTTEKTNI